VEISAFRCRMWELHDRMEEHISEETCKAEIESFSRQGQLVPVLGRVLDGDQNYDAELIYGARRLFVARHLNKPLLVELRPSLSDREALIAMDSENRLRSDISPYERGLSFARWLRTGHFKSQDDIARALRVSASLVSRLLRFGELPSVIVSAFSTPMSIRETWGLQLAEELSDPAKRPQLIRAARVITAMPQRPPDDQIYRKLIAAAAQGRKIKPRTHDEVVKDSQGRPLFRIRQQTNSIAVVLPASAMSVKILDRIRQSTTQILLDGN